MRHIKKGKEHSEMEKYVWIFFFACIIFALSFDFNITVYTTMLGIFLLMIGFFRIFLEPQVNIPKEGFSCPASPLVPSLGILCNCLLAGSLPGQTWYVFLVWIAIGVIVYFLYGVRHSNLNMKNIQ